MREQTGNRKAKDLKLLESEIRQIAHQLEGLNDRELTTVYVKLLSSISDINDIRKAMF